MNNNRGNNNRRRGRGNNRQNGGGQQLNRIDSRARGNAPQLLEKYRKMAHDAHLNGDRVNEEYYLQFADHYFRVIADTRVRQEEQRLRRDERWQEGGEGYRDDGDDAGEFGGESEYAPYDQQASFAPRREREERSRDDRPQREERSQREDRPEREGRSQREDRPQREDRRRDERNHRDDRQPERTASDDQGEDQAADAANPYEPAENPFTRDNRTRGLKPRRDREDRRPRRESRQEGSAEDDDPAGLDPSMLPPAISAGRDEPAEPAVVADEDAKPRRRTRKPKPPADDAGEALEAVG